MSLTSYRAAPPRVTEKSRRPWENTTAPSPEKASAAGAPARPIIKTARPSAPNLQRLSDLPSDDQIVMRLLAYHGMRGGEACQLRACDISCEYGIDVLTLTDAAGSIKNRPSLRTIPLHPACRDLVALALSKAPDAYLFDYPAWRHGRAGKFQQRANKWLRSIGITDPKVTVHSWRHAWRTLARELEMPEACSSAILGHTLGDGEHGKYGGPPSLKRQAEWLAKIDPLAG